MAPPGYSADNGLSTDFGRARDRRGPVQEASEQASASVAPGWRSGAECSGVVGVQRLRLDSGGRARASDYGLPRLRPDLDLDLGDRQHVHGRRRDLGSHRTASCVVVFVLALGAGALTLIALETALIVHEKIKEYLGARYEQAVCGTGRSPQGGRGLTEPASHVRYRGTGFRRRRRHLFEAERSITPRRQHGPTQSG